MRAAMTTELQRTVHLPAQRQAHCHVRVPVLLGERPINRSADRRELRVPNWTFTGCWLAGDGESRNMSAIYTTEARCLSLPRDERLQVSLTSLPPCAILDSTNTIHLTNEIHKYDLVLPSLPLRPLRSLALYASTFIPGIAMWYCMLWVSNSRILTFAQISAQSDSLDQSEI